MKFLFIALILIVSNAATFYFSSNVEGPGEYSPAPIIEQPKQSVTLPATVSEGKNPEQSDLVDEEEEPSQISLSELGDIILTLEDSAVRDRLLEVLTTNWFMEDHRALAEWINKQPREASVDTAVATFSGLASEIDPEGAAEWAVSVVSPNLRETAIRRTMSSFRSNNPGGYERFLQGDSYAAREIRVSDYYVAARDAVAEEAERFDIYEEPPEPIERILARRTRLAGSSSRTNNVELID